MISLIGQKITEKSRKDPREVWGTLCGTAGIVLNLMLCISKAFAGILSGSIAVTADALNNLSDAGSSIISLAGFRLAAKKPDRRHPFGHGRTEYISGLVIAFIIMMMGFELAKSSVTKIISPEEVEFGWLTVGILLASVAVKLYMFSYNRRIGKRIGSSTLTAAAMDSLSDCISTGATIISLFVLKFTGFNADGYVGAAVALFILWSGLKAAKETIQPLLGSAPDPEFVKKAQDIVLSYEGIVGIHDIVVHDYGPGRVMISLHAEVPEDACMNDAHELVDRVERELGDRLGCHAVIHMDPIATNDIELERIKNAVREIVASWDGKFTIHDFRMVRGVSRTNIIFDVVLPFESKMSEEEVKETLGLAIHGIDPKYFAVINVDRPFQ